MYVCLYILFNLTVSSIDTMRLCCINMEKKKALLWLFLFFSAFLFRLSVSSSRSLSSITDQAQYSSGKDLHYDFQVALGNREEEEIFREGRMDIETRDYSKTGANNHHDPRPPGSF